MFELTREQISDMIIERTGTAESIINELETAVTDLVRDWRVTFVLDNSQTANNVSEVEDIFEGIRDEFISDN